MEEEERIANQQKRRPAEGTSRRPILERGAWAGALKSGLRQAEVGFGFTGLVSQRGIRGKAASPVG